MQISFATKCPKGVKCKAISYFPLNKMINSTSNSIQLLHPYSKVKIDSIYTLSQLKAFGVIIFENIKCLFTEKREQEGHLMGHTIFAP